MAIQKITGDVIATSAVTADSLADTTITAAKLHTTLDLTGKTVTVATASAGDNDTTVASTAFVSTAVANLADSAPSTLDTLNELAAALGDDANFSTTVTTSIATKAPLDSPVFSSTYTSGQDETLAEFRRDGGAVAAKIIYADATTDMEFGTTTSHALSLTTADTRRLTIDSSGNVGIGTSSPVTALEISTDGADHLTLNRADASININNVLGGIVVSADDPTANRSGAKIGFTAGANWTTNNFPTNIIFSNDASGTMTERMRIDSGGRVMMGTSTNTGISNNADDLINFVV